MRRLVFGLAILLSIIGALSGCSYIFVQPLPPNYRPTDDIDCTTSQTPPEVDLLITLVSVSAVAFWAAQDGFRNVGKPAVVGFVAAAP